MLWSAVPLLLFFLTAGPQECPAQELQLANAHLTARFGPGGLESIQEKGGPNRAIASDAFSLQIDSDIFSSQMIQPVLEQHDTSQVRYLFRESGYSAEVVYRIEPSWRFITKQIRILSTPRPEFVVHRLDPVDVAFNDAANSLFVPGTYLPQFGPRPPGGKQPADDFGAFVRFSDSSGVMLLVQNPFLHVKHASNRFLLGYEPDLAWKPSWGAFVGDIACIGPYTLTGERIPQAMTYEWKLPTQSSIRQGADRAEIEAFTDCVRAFLIHPSRDPITVETGWTLNDYQIDVATEEGRADYKRIIDSTAALGIRTLVYSPSNSALARREEDADTWGWEHVLWLGLGQKLREAQWNVETGEIPSSVSDMLQYARSKDVGLLAYVYPSLPFSQNRNWLVKLGAASEKNTSATLASRDFQDFLIKALIDFKKRTGIAGYSFDYAFFDLPGSTAYAQWFGWRRVLESLRRADPDIVIDGRQSYQEYGPWSWLSGSYPHPTGNDEQPESFTPYPDLHFDRVSADRTRFVNYWYRNYQFAPEQIMPGYMTHQTERSVNIPPDSVTGGHPSEVKLMETAYRLRDWDFLGFKYSVLSSIATAGWNNVFDMIPARDPQERHAFRGSDSERWIRSWLAWTVENKTYLEHTVSILGPPTMGKADGTAAIVGDHGYVFLFNPNYKQVTAEFSLNSQIGLTAGTEFLIRELSPNQGRIVGKPGAGIWQRGDTVRTVLDGTSATVFKIQPLVASLKAPLPVNAFAEPSKAPPSATVDHGKLKLEHVSGEPGTSVEIGALLAANSPIQRMTVNGRALPHQQHGRYVFTHVSFAGTRFAQAQQIDLAEGSGGAYTGTFVVPERICAQRKIIEQAWPIEWRPEDYQTTWLVPKRLLLFLQFAEPEDTMAVALRLDNKPVPLSKAYSSVRAHAASFVGFYADLSTIKADVPHTVMLQIPSGRGQRFQGLFFENVLPELTEGIRQ